MNNRYVKGTPQFMRLSDISNQKGRSPQQEVLFPLVQQNKRRYYRRGISFKTIAKIVLGLLCLAVFFVVIPSFTARAIIVGLGILYTVLQLA